MRTVECWICHEKFETKGKNARYCERCKIIREKELAHKSNLKRSGFKPCEKCGKPFYGTHKARFCLDHRQEVRSESLSKTRRRIYAERRGEYNEKLPGEMVWELFLKAIIMDCDGLHDCNTDCRMQGICQWGG